MTATRLKADDWIHAALDLMAGEGVAAVKVHRLCARLGVTKGSFYWHFTDLDTFLGEVARRWRDAGDGEVARRWRDAGGGRGDADPKRQLLEASKRFARPEVLSLQRAMRDWARTDSRARAAVRAVDQALHRRLVEAFCALGFERHEADVRAKLLFYAGVGFSDVGPIGDRSSPQRQLETLIELLAGEPETQRRGGEVETCPSSRARQTRRS